MTIRSWAVLIVLWTSLAPPARADSDAPPAPPPKADVAAAAASFERGSQLLARGDHAGAIAQFEQAYLLDPRSEHLYNLAIAHRRNADRARAIDYFRRYLDAAPTGKLAGNAHRFLAELKAEVAADAEQQARAEADAARKRAEQAEAETVIARRRADDDERALRAAPRAQLPAPVIAPPRLSSADPGVVDDAGAGHGWLAPTALTAPAGTLALSDVELAMISASYAVTDRLAVSAGATLPVGSQRGAGATAKLQLVRHGRLRVAAHGMVAHTWTSGERGPSETITLGDLGGAATVCIDPGCRSHVSGYLGAGMVHDAGTSGVLVGGATVTFALGRITRAVFELDRGAGHDRARGMLGWYGLRLTSSSIALDLGLAQPLGDATTHLGRGVLPFIGFTYRSLGEP